MLSCPECDAVLDVAEAELEEGGTICCEECGANLVVVATDPAIELQVEGEEDLEDDEEFEDELDDEDAELDDEEEDSEEDDEDWPH
jgi:alpha-aminoadipate carrier protein LysW